MSDQQKNNGKLFSQAHELAQSVTLDELHRLTKLPTSWLKKFRRGAINDPSVNRIEKILKAFKATPLV